MPDGPRKAMSREPEDLLEREKRIREFHMLGRIPDAVTCEECGGLIFAGDWPWCGGDAKRHER